MAAKKTKKKKKEFSKIACSVASLGLFFLGVWMVYRYYSLVQLAIATSSSVVPDAALPIAGISFILAPLISYLLYQGGLKNSRNKYGIDEEGQPYHRTLDSCE